MGAVPTNWDWNSLVAAPEAKIAVSARPGVVAELSKYGSLSSIAPSNSPNIPKAALQRILELCPCLYAQINLQVTARAVVHLCEVTPSRRAGLGRRRNAETEQANHASRSHPRVDRVAGFRSCPMQANPFRQPLSATWRRSARSAGGAPAPPHTHARAPCRAAGHAMLRIACSAAWSVSDSDHSAPLSARPMLWRSVISAAPKHLNLPALRSHLSQEIREVHNFQ